jgi:hypothetical protein
MLVSDYDSFYASRLGEEGEVTVEVQLKKQMIIRVELMFTYVAKHY